MREQAIVDFHTAARRDRNFQLSLRPLYAGDWLAKETKTEKPSSHASKGKGKDPELYDLSDDDNEPSSRSRPGNKRGAARPSLEDRENNRDEVKLEDDNLVIMCPMLHAFSLKEKRWSKSIPAPQHHCCGISIYRSLIIDITVAHSLYQRGQCRRCTVRQ